jgi:hypothetical protein
MTNDFWIIMMWTILLSLITIIFHFLISLYILLSNAIVNIEAFFDKYDDGSKSWNSMFKNLKKCKKGELLDVLEKIIHQLETVESLKRTIFTWGMDLSLLAFSVDFVILASWLLHEDCFPFFSRWNSAGIHLETPIWTILLFGHFLIFAITVWLNYLNTIKLQYDKAHLIPLSNIFSMKWLHQYVYFIAGMFLGFLSLASNFIIIWNAI